MNDILEKIELNFDEIKISDETLEQWQQLLNMILEITDAEDALINNYQAPYLKVQKSSIKTENYFSEGDKFKVEGLYCADVIADKASLEVNNAAEIKKWQDSVYMENGLTAYLGFPILWPNGEIYGTICVHDRKERYFSRTERKQLKFVKDLIENNLEIVYQNQLNLSLKKYYSNLIDQLPVGVMIEDQEGKILSVNQKMTEITGFNKENLLGNTVFETVVPEKQLQDAEENIEKILAGEVLVHERAAAKENGLRTYLRLQERKIMLPNGKAGIISIQSDISEKVKAQKEIKYASFHDSLTGLFNRSYLEKQMRNCNLKCDLPITIIMADLNGLKLVNDTYGHSAGDQLLKNMAEILNQSCRSNDIIARWGGDEFVILLPQADQNAAEKIVERINKNISQNYIDFNDGNRLPLSAAVGYALKNSIYTDIFEVLDQAEDEMYKNKLTESKSVKSNILNTLLKTLSEKSRETVGHSNRMAELAKKMALQLDLSQTELNKLTLIAKLHDIGKTVVAEDILNKKGELTAAEWDEIREHPAVGHRILNATEEFSHISDEILSHHERWDGSGYPRGLEAEEIPLLARIIAIVDAYDVMTNDQVYQQALSEEEALAEIAENAGTQFDPELAELFIELRQDKI